MRNARLWFVLVVATLFARAASGAGGPAPKILQTPGGIRYGLLGERHAAPAPTLFLFATTIETTLGDANYSQVGRVLLPAGVLVVSVDVPGHGQDRREGEPDGIAAWPGRVSRDEALVGDFAKRCSAVLDHLVAEKQADPGRVGAAGTSRGGYMALQFAAADPRVRAVAGFAPVTRPAVLTEFSGMKTDPRVEALALTTVADRLAGRSVWLTIGNDDARVSTDECVAFARRLVAVSKEGEQKAASGTASDPKSADAKLRDVSIEVLPAAGHRTPIGAHERAAAWFKVRLAK
ncbi:MAG TPA: prolyl oligopeptidase family serine peptidase [Pirellulales bacterium]|jgi:dienelactone hydrolase